MGGSWWNNHGSASTYLCLPTDPSFDNHTIPRYGSAEVFGGEYEVCDEPRCDMLPVCSVCHTPRAANMVIPGRDTCYPGWQLEYSGYLMTNRPDFAASMQFVCVDRSLGYVPGTHSNENGALFHYTRFRCGSLSCPPYQEGKTVLCAVCSK